MSNSSSVFFPLVSIIIPVYNGSNYIRECIDSALAQTYENTEIIVVNDGSNDEGKTEEIVLSYGDKITYLKKENGGVSSALNLGIANMKGEYFSWLSHDDKYDPHKIEKQIEALRNLEDKKTVVLCSSKTIDKDSKVYYEAKSKFLFPDGCIVSWDEAAECIFKYGSYNGCALLIHKSVFEKVGLFDEKLRYVQDMLMWSRIFLGGYSMYYIHDQLVLSRIHDGQLTQTGKELFHKESVVMAEDIMPILIRLNGYSRKLLYAFANYNATYNNKAVVERILFEKEYSSLLSFVMRFKIRLRALYGRIRPIIRRLYYKWFLKVKTR